MVADREASLFALHKLRKFTGWYTHGLQNGRRLRQAINQLPDVATFLSMVEEFLGELLVEEATGKGEQVQFSSGLIGRSPDQTFKKQQRRMSSAAPGCSPP
jgi:hypothetical protein